MISDAVQALLESYNCYEEIEAVKKKRNYVDKQLEIFTEEGLKYLENQLTNKPSDNSKQEIIRYNKLLTKYNVYTARILVRCDSDGKLYLYDLVRTKKETSSPPEQ